MARETEELLIALRADLNQFEKNFAKAHGISVGQMRKIQRQVEGDATKIERRMATMGNNIRGSLLAAFTIGGGMALGNAIAEAVQKIADLKEAAESAGVSVADLQRLTFAGVGAGLSQEDIVSMLQKLNKELAKAKAEGKNVGTTTEEFLKLADAVAGANTAIEATGIVTDKLGKTGAKAIPLLAQGGAELKRQMGEAQVASDALSKAADDFYDKWSQKIVRWGTLFNSEIAKAALALNALVTRQADLTQAQMRQRIEALQEHMASMRALPGGEFINAIAIARASEEVEQLQELLREMSRIPRPGLMQTGSGEGDTETEPAADTVKKIQDRVEDLYTEIEKTPDAGLEALNTKLAEMRDALVDIEKMGVDSFFSWIEGTQSAKEALADLAKQLAKLAFQAALFGTGPFATLTGGQDSGLLSMLNSFLIPGRAGGGPVNRGSPYMVGERGPELFVPSQSGKIIPGSGRGGGGAGNVTINNYAGAQVSTQRSGPSGRDLIVLIEQVGDARFARNLSQNAPLIGGRPVSKRTS